MSFPAVFSLSSLDGTNGFRIPGLDIGDFSGFSVSSAGDVNGDGIDDLIIGAAGGDASATSAGESYVIFGRATGFATIFDLTSLDGSNGFRLDGINSTDLSGQSVSSAGDVNGDGINDIIIGAPSADPNGMRSAGETYVVFGQTNGFGASFNLEDLDGSNGFSLAGIDTSDLSGVSVASAGDVNGDGIDDVIIGASNASPSATAAGESYVVFGQSTAFDSSLNLVDLDGDNGFRLNGINNSDSSGTSVSSAGDFNGDGFDDVIIGAPYGDVGDLNTGESYIVFGQDNGFSADIDLNSLTGSNGFRLAGFIAVGQSGISVSSAGDVNGDGFDDVIIGAHRDSRDGNNQIGASYVVFGHDDDLGASFDLADLDGHNGFRLDGVDAGDQSGISVSSAGDVNGDGFDDLIVGASRASVDGNAEAGESYVVFGQAAGFSASIDLASLDGTNGFRIEGINEGDRSGYTVSSAGDINGDGFDDIIIGAAFSDLNGNTDAGESYVVFGAAPDSDVVRFGSDVDQTIRGGTGDDYINGLGGDDVLFGGAGDDVLVGGLNIDTVLLNPGDTTNQYLELTDFNEMPASNMTIEWLFRSEGAYPEEFTEFHFMSYAVGSGSLSNELLLSGVEGGNIYIRANGEEFFDTGIPTITVLDGAVHRMSFVLDHDDTRIFLYIDGTLVSETILPTFGDIAPGGTLIFGQEQDSIGGGFKPATITRGELADIRIWDGLRSAEEIADLALVQTPQPSTQPDLVANWQMDASNGSIYNEASGSVGNLTLRSTPDNTNLPSFGNFGAGGNDVFYDGAGNDDVYGGQGDDLFVAGTGANTYSGGNGIDTLDYSAFSTGIKIDLAKNSTFGGAPGNAASNDTFYGVENIIGTKGDDVLLGSHSGNRLDGGAGDDFIDGRGGDNPHLFWRGQ